MATALKPRFSLRAASRMPTLGRDYDPTTHRYSSEYVNPTGYVLVIDAFPGKDVIIPAADQQLRPGADPKTLRDIERLRLPLGTVAFDFRVEGSVRKRLAIGKTVLRKFSLSNSRPLSSLTGSFDEKRDDNPWDWHAQVPGLGSFTVTVGWRNRRGGVVSSSRKITTREFLVVAIGDSASAGQGVPDVPGQPEGFSVELEWYDVFVPVLGAYKLASAAIDRMRNYLKQHFTTLARAAKARIDMSPKPVWLEPKAYRSLRSAPAMAASLLEDQPNGTVVTFLPFGRTGSEIGAGLIGPRTDGGVAIDDWIGNIGQIEEVRRTVGSRRIDALLIYIGINDVGVAGSLAQMITGDNRLLGSGGDLSERHKVKAKGLERIAEVPGKLDALATALSGLNIRHVYLTEYPAGLFDRKNGVAGGCGVFTSFFDADLTSADARVLKELAIELNATLRTEAARHGWFFVTGVVEDFRNHGYCSGEDRLFVQAEESMILQGDTEGTVHPNRAGARLIGHRIAAMVKRMTFDVPEDAPTKLASRDNARKAKR